MKYELDRIFNVDETGLFCRLLPRRSYLASGETRKAARGVKGVKAEDRITVSICTNQRKGKAAADIHRHLEKSQMPRPACRCCVPGAEAWFDTRTFDLWYKN